MKPALAILGILALSVLPPAQQDSDSQFPATPNPDPWSQITHKIDSERLLANGVPDRYHYLYLLHSNIDDDTIRKGLPFTKISLSRSRCFGKCPAYEVDFSVTGDATYNGIAHTMFSGKQNAQVSLHDFGRICWAIERLKLTDAQPKPNRVIHDTSVTKLTVTSNSGKVIEVTDHGSPSQIELLLVSTLIDRVADTTQWK